ncbi:MAG: hypothetical protein E7Y34_02470 [Mycoplasma sp.]|nr:hypothetical protein [Mycoplasma sp.]
MQRVLRFRFSDLFCAIPETFMGFQIPEGDGTYGGGDLGVIIKNPKEIGQKDDKTKEPKGEAPTINEADLIAKVEAKLEAKIRAKIDAEFRAKAKKEAEDKAKKEAEDKAKKEAEDKAKKEAEINK